jgi:hypothetical protein
MPLKTLYDDSFLVLQSFVRKKFQVRPVLKKDPLLRKILPFFASTTLPVAG